MIDDEWQIGQLIARFANSFDLKAWDALHHLAGNPEITVEGPRGRCRTSMVIWRRDGRGGAFVPKA